MREKVQFINRYSECQLRVCQTWGC